MHRQAVMRLSDIDKAALFHLLDHSGKRNPFPFASRIYLPGRNIHCLLSELFVSEFQGQSDIFIIQSHQK